MNNQKFYIKNKKYSDFLNTQQKKNFTKYADWINKLLLKNNSFLDVGCGTGIALTLVNTKKKCKGIDISKTSVASCISKGLDCQIYDGHKLPFVNDSFDIVGSFNVLEHTDCPASFLDEQFRILSKGGYLIVACPNFLSITNNFHWHTSGLKQKTENLVHLIKKISDKDYNFEKMKTIKDGEFRVDNDACNITNPIDILKWSKKNKLKVKYWSSRSVYEKNQLVNFVDKTIFKFFFGSCFLIFKKNEN